MEPVWKQVGVQESSDPFLASASKPIRIGCVLGPTCLLGFGCYVDSMKGSCTSGEVYVPCNFIYTRMPGESYSDWHRLVLCTQGPEASGSSS